MSVGNPDLGGQEAVRAVSDGGALDQRAKLVHDDLLAEYGQLVSIVSSFDQRLLTIKGWGVTLSLALLGTGFQQQHYGLFLVAALSGLAFWLIEGVTKYHQMRYYPRMGDIEVALYGICRVDVDGLPISSPLIDWSWSTAKDRLGRGPARRQETLHEMEQRTTSPVDREETLQFFVPRRWPVLSGSG